MFFHLTTRSLFPGFWEHSPAGTPSADPLPAVVLGPLHPCPYSYLLLQAQDNLWEEKCLLRQLSECLAAPAAFVFQQRFQPHGGNPVIAEHWGRARRLSRWGAEMLATYFGHLCPREMAGPSVCPGTLDGSPAE